jgi:tRNA(Ile)-lysidine synthetase-like protein
MNSIYIVTILIIVTILFAFFYNIIYCKKKVEKKNDDFQYLLETPKDYYFGMEDILSIDLDNPLVKTMDDFCLLNNIYSNGAIVSLSGGVDSMVVLAILIRLSMINKFNIYACSINYNLRDEQSDEIKFIEKYCNTHNVKLYIASISGYSRKKEESGPRTEFEEESRKIRFDLYTEVMNKHNCNGIFVGHHKDDIIENIFTNSMKGSNILDMEVMKKNSTIHNVIIFRPFLDFQIENLDKKSRQVKILPNQKDFESINKLARELEKMDLEKSKTHKKVGFDIPESSTKKAETTSKVNKTIGKKEK